jgi:hypothetical protein
VTNQLFLNAARGPNTIDVQGMSIYTSITAGWSNDTINVGDPAGSLRSLTGGNLGILFNNPGSQVVLNDQGNANVVTYTLKPGDTNPPSSAIFASDSAPIYLIGPLRSLLLNGSNGRSDPTQSDRYNIENTFTNTTINASAASNIFRLSPTDQYLVDIEGPLTLNGTGNDILEFFDANNPNTETYTFDNIPSTLSLATLPTFAVNWTGMGSVYLMTNGMSTVNDPSGTVIVDPQGGPPYLPHGPDISISSDEALAAPLVEAAFRRGLDTVSDHPALGHSLASISSGDSLASGQDGEIGALPWLPGVGG